MLAERRPARYSRCKKYKDGRAVASDVRSPPYQNSSFSCVNVPACPPGLVWGYHRSGRSMQPPLVGLLFLCSGLSKASLLNPVQPPLLGVCRMKGVKCMHIHIERKFSLGWRRVTSLKLRPLVAWFKGHNRQLESFYDQVSCIGSFLASAGDLVIITISC